MMGPSGIKLDRVVFPTEFQTVLGLIEIINNKDKMEKVLKDIKSHAEKANKLIELVGKAEEIGKLHSKALAQQQETDTIVINAQAEAATILSGALEKSESMASESQESASKLLARAETANSDVIQKQQAIQTVQAEQAATNQAQQKREKDLINREQKLVKAEQELERKRSILAQL